MSDYEAEYGKEDLKTSGLDDHFDAMPAGSMERLSGPKLIQAIRNAFSTKPDDLPDPSNHQHRVFVLWRIARAMARLTGICAEDETLDATTNDKEIDPWFVGIKAPQSPAMQQLIRKATASRILAVYARGPVPLLPSPTTMEQTDRWFEAASVLADDLGVHRNEIGRRGMQGMHDPRTCQWAGVTSRQIMALEDLLVDEAQNLIIKVGERPAVQIFRTRYGFARSEALGLMRLARAEALRMDGSSVEENRAIMVSQLKDFLARSKSACNQKDELSALKELGRVQGLTRTEPEDAAREFYETVARVASRQDRERALALPEGSEPRIVEAVPAGEAAPNDPEYDFEDDPQALAAWDRENRR